MTAEARVRPRYVEPVKTGFRFRDFIVIIFCLTIVVFFINLFRLDLFQTINLQNVEPVGTITIKNNTVQRRIADRVLWDRLIIESPVYLGDIIRVAEMSSAILNIEGQQLDIGENTLIRIQLAPNGEGLQIQLSEGSIGIIVTEESVNQGFAPLQVNMNGSIIKPTAGASITASASDTGTSIQVNEGIVLFTSADDNTSTVISEGEVIAFNNEGESVEAQPLRVFQAIDLNEVQIQNTTVVGFIEPLIAPEPIIVTNQAIIPEPEPEIVIVETIPVPPPPFNAPANRLPSNNQVYGIEQLRTQRNIVFSWSAVQGANAYIITIFQQTASGGRRQINSVTVTSARWTLADISILGKGTFIWQVEAIYRNANGTIERRGRIEENSFTMDIPSPNPIQADSPGVLYGY